tara:strand:- start:1260 stop:1691 length:432 start_codon:yes stop_codon:yes gene_type:complete
LTKEVSIAKAFDIYLNCKPKKDGDFSLNDFFKFDKNKNIQVLTEYNGIAVYSSVEEESELYFLGIEEHKKNIGYGARLLQKVITDSKALGAKAIFIEVNELNKVAIKLYVKCGFKKYGVRKNYYKNALNSFDDAVLMKLQLQS